MVRSISRVLLAVRLGQRESHEDWVGPRPRSHATRTSSAAASDQRRHTGADQVECGGVAESGPRQVQSTNCEMWSPNRRSNPVCTSRSRLHTGQLWMKLPTRGCRTAAARTGRRTGAAHPRAAACLAEDLPTLCVHLRCFPRLRKRFRSGICSSARRRKCGVARSARRGLNRYPRSQNAPNIWSV